MLAIGSVFLIAGSFGKQTKSDNILLLPSWFWDPSLIEGKPSAVGYSLPHIDSPHTWDEAFEQAAWLLFLDKSLKVSGIQNAASTPWGRILTDDSLFADIEIDQFQYFVKSVVALDTFLLPDQMRVVLAATKTANVNRHLIPCPMEQPTLPESFGIGISQSFYNESSSWFEAEVRARLSLAQRNIGIKGEQTETKSDINEDYYDKYCFETDAKLSNVRTVARRIDPQSRARMVWVTGHVE